AAGLDADGRADLVRDLRADAMDIGQGDGDALGVGDVHAGDTCQVRTSFRCGSVAPEPFFTTSARGDFAPGPGVSMILRDGARPRRRLIPCGMRCITGL